MFVIYQLKDLLKKIITTIIYNYLFVNSCKPGVHIHTCTLVHTPRTLRKFVQGVAEFVANYNFDVSNSGFD